MKILLTTLSFDPERGGGTTERTRNLAAALRDAGHGVAVAGIEPGRIQAELADRGIVTYATGLLTHRFARISLPRLGRLVAEADAIHVLGYWNFLSVATAWLARRAGKPYVLSAAGELSNLDALRPVPAIFHRVFGRPMFAGARAIVAITELERSIIAAATGRPAEQIVVLPNGVAESTGATAPTVELPTGPYALFLGRLATIKGPDLLIEAFARVAPEFPDYRLVMAGPEFGLGDSLRRAVDASGLADRIVFTGYLNETERTAALQRSAFLVVPSRSEAMSMVALEAGIQGKPVLATDTCGLAALAAVDGGGICPPTVDGLADGLRQMFGAADLPARGQRWRQFVSANYRWPDIAARLAAMLEGLT